MKQTANIINPAIYNADTDEVNVILNALEKFINQRPGLDPANYGASYEQNVTIDKHFNRESFRQGCRALRNERARITKDGREARELLSEARSYPADLKALKEAFRAFSGRLQWNGKELEYCTGQYFPTEYRPAAAAVLRAYIHDVRPKSLPPENARFESLADIKAAAYNAGSHWFERGTMKFFRTRLVPQVFNGVGGIFFVSSEQREDYTPRCYTVRQFDPKTADVDTVGEFNVLSKGQALKLARLCAAGNQPNCAKCTDPKHRRGYEGTGANWHQYTPKGFMAA